MPSSKSDIESNTYDAPPQPPRTSVPELLLADDQHAVRRLIKLMLKPLDCSICEAVDGADALEQFLAEPERFRAALLDVRMPELSGIEVMETLLAIRPELPIFLVTGSPDHLPDQVPPQVKVILKPFEGAELREQIRRAL